MNQYQVTRGGKTYTFHTPEDAQMFANFYDQRHPQHVAQLQQQTYSPQQTSQPKHVAPLASDTIVPKKTIWSNPTVDKILYISMIVVDVGLLGYVAVLYSYFHSLATVPLLPVNFFVNTLLVVIIVNITRFVFLLVWNIVKRRKTETHSIISSRLGE